MRYGKVIEQGNLKEDLDGVSFLVSVVSNSYGTAFSEMLTEEMNRGEIPAGE